LLGILILFSGKLLIRSDWKKLERYFPDTSIAFFKKQEEKKDSTNVNDISKLQIENGYRQTSALRFGVF